MCDKTINEAMETDETQLNIEPCIYAHFPEKFMFFPYHHNSGGKKCCLNLNPNQSNEKIMIGGNFDFKKIGLFEPKRTTKKNKNKYVNILN